MKCPYCGKKLRRTSSGWLICDECKIHMPENAWKKRVEKKEVEKGERNIKRVSQNNNKNK